MNLCANENVSRERWINCFNLNQTMFYEKEVTHATLNDVCKSVASGSFVIFTYILEDTWEILLQMEATYHS